MKSEVGLTKYKRRVLGLSAGLFLLAIYLLVYRGGFHSVDEVSIFAVAESLAKFGQFNTDPVAWTQWTTTQAEAQGFFGQDGHVYSKKGLALSLAQAPLYWLAVYLPGVGMLQTVSLLNAFVTAATGLLILMFLQRLNFSLFTSLTITLIFGLATIAFVYAKYLFSEPLAGFLLLLAAYMLFAYRQEGGLRHLAIAGLSAGLAVLTRANNLFLLPIFGLYLLWVVYAEARRQENVIALSPYRLIPLGVFFLTAGLIGTVMMGYNAARSGHPLQTGYDLTLFSPNLLSGLYKLLFSPLRGFFVYSPILLLSLPGWWRFRRLYPAEAWLFAGLVGVTIALFSAWSSGEGLSWGSRFLVPVVPFFALCLAPVVETGQCPVPAQKLYVLRFTFFVLLSLSLLIQILGVTINPWVFLGQLQAEFGGEFFLEKTAAMYDFRYSQIVGQLQAWSTQNSDLAWWQPWGFDGLAFGLSVGLVLLTGWFLWRQITTNHQPPTTDGKLISKFYRPIPILSLLTLSLTYFLLTRYYFTDRQFGPPDDGYTRALETVAAQSAPGEQIVTVAPYHYHVPMNRFKARLPITGLAQHSWPPPETALPLLNHTLSGQNAWLVTIGLPPAAPDNAAERWLVENAFLTDSTWFDDVRLVRFDTRPPMLTHTLNVTLGSEIRLVEIKLADSPQPGQALPVQFTWQPLKKTQADYNLFLQLLNAQGVLAAQHDSPPNDGYTPTSTWTPGQTVIARHALLLPPDLSPGDYRLIVGLYNPATGVRLPVTPTNDFVDLGQITLNAQTANGQHSN